MERDENRVRVRLFVGVPLSTEISIKLNHSLAWKESTFGAGMALLNITTFQGNEYVGKFADYKELTIKDLKNIEQQVLDALFKYSPEINIDKLEPEVFPQVFAG